MIRWWRRRTSRRLAKAEARNASRRRQRAKSKPRRRGGIPEPDKTLRYADPFE